MKLSAPQILQPPLGCQISYADWLQLIAYMESFSGMATALSNGVTDALPPIQPVSMVFGSGLSVAVGGTDNNNGCQFALCQGILCASAGNPVGTQYNFTIPSNSTGSTRIDAIAMQPSTQQVTVTPRKVEQPDGSKPIQNVPVVINGLAIQYIEGPNGGGNPGIPSGWEKFAHIAVPNGAVSLDDSAITLFFPYLNANAFTTTTSGVTIPAIGSTVTLPVNDTSVWVAGDVGYAIGPASANAFLFNVVSVDANTNTMLVTNLNTTIQGNGLMVVGALVLPAATAPVSCTTTTTTVFKLPADGGLAFDINVSNAGAFPIGSFGYVVGVVNSKSFYFQVVGQGNQPPGGPYIRVQTVAIGQGGPSLIGSTILTGSLVFNSSPPALMEEDQDNGGFLNPTQPIRAKKGTVTIGTAGGTAAVTFDPNLPYSSSSSYAISLAANAAALDASYTNKTASGFTIKLNGSGTGNVGWSTKGY